MTKCDYCGKTIVFGAAKHGQFNYCDDTCRRNGIAQAAAAISDESIREYVQQIHSGPCPRCKQQAGPVDVWTTHKIWSFVVMTRYSSEQQISCRPCGIKAMRWSALSSFVLGWWGVPWGVLMTPVQVFNNLIGMSRKASTEPTPELSALVRKMLASDGMARAQR